MRRRGRRRAYKRCRLDGIEFRPTLVQIRLAQFFQLVLIWSRGVAVLIDQHTLSRDAIYVDFFERPAATTSAVAALALRTGAPILPVFALPLPGGRYRMIYEHAVEPPPPDHPDPVRELTQRCTDVLEMYVRRYPELWLWMHRRWREVGPTNVRGMFPAAEPESPEPQEP